MSNKPTEAQVAKAREDLVPRVIAIAHGYKAKRYEEAIEASAPIIAQALADAVAEERARTLVVTDVSDRGAAAAIMAMWRLFRGDEKLFEETLSQQLAHAANRGRTEERAAAIVRIAKLEQTVLHQDGEATTREARIARLEAALREIENVELPDYGTASDIASEAMKQRP